MPKGERPEVGMLPDWKRDMDSAAEVAKLCQEVVLAEELALELADLYSEVEETMQETEESIFVSSAPPNRYV